MLGSAQAWAPFAPSLRASGRQQSSPYSSVYMKCAGARVDRRLALSRHLVPALAALLPAAKHASAADSTSIRDIVNGLPTATVPVAVLAIVALKIVVAPKADKSTQSDPSPPSSGPTSLPPGWQQGTDPRTGSTYYYNEQGATQWDAPK